MERVKRPEWVSQNLWEPKAPYSAPYLKGGLPDGRVFATCRKMAGLPSQAIINRMGVTAVMDVDAFDKYRSLWQKSETIGNTGKKSVKELTPEDMINVAHMFPLCPIEGNEFGEGPFAIYPHHDDLYKWFYSERKRMYEEAGLPYRNYGTYGNLSSYNQNYPWRKSDGSIGKPTDSEFRRNYESQDNARRTCDYFIAGFDKVVGANVKDYADLPDYRKTFYSKHDAMRVMGKGLGKVGGIGPGFLVYFDWANIEGLDNAHDLHNGFFLERELPDGSGTVITTPHIKIDYHSQVSRIFFNAFVMGDGYVTFDTGDLYGLDPNVIPSLNEYSQDRANVVRFISKNGKPAPVSYAGYFEEPCRWHDAGYEAAYYYESTRLTEGNPWRDANFVFHDGQVYKGKSDESGILDVAQDEAPLIMYRTDGRNISLAGVHPAQEPHQESSAFVRLPNGSDLMMTFRGNQLQVFNGIL